LTVQFQSNTRHGVAWEFGDGAESKVHNPTHTFTQPGIFNVTLTVTDDHGISARGNVVILADRDSSEPIVRSGLGKQDHPNLDVHGTAKRGEDGGWVFPNGPPFGRAETPDDATDSLGGLRSFTIAGWLKPDKLHVGSGGNRILFCLQRNNSGIDLVHLDDGRMRLSVNEWPDRVKNDSSPRKLQVGKWTFFAVTYNALSRRDNVAWYFGKPTESPDSNVEVQLDRKNTYNAGPVANHTGPLAIGNFNRTMRNYGWDRQFRGQINGLMVFGSRIGHRGALDLATLQSLKTPSRCQ
jgi:hypothetical protein